MKYIPLPQWWQCLRNPCFDKVRAPCSCAEGKWPAAKAAAAAPACLVSLLLVAACLHRLLPQDFAPLAGFVPLAGSVPLGGSAPLGGSVVPADFAAPASSATTGGPDSTGAAARYSAVLCFVAL